MKKEIKEKWITALRSGEYRQTDGSLCNNGGYCCLGVLCDLYAKEKGIVWTDKTDNIPVRQEKKLLGHSALLPAEVVEWAGFTKDEIGRRGMIHGTNVKTKTGDFLSTLNDNRTLFTEIAEIIEQDF